jgi:hypothetical protein
MKILHCTVSELVGLSPEVIQQLYTAKSKQGVGPSHIGVRQPADLKSVGNSTKLHGSGVNGCKPSTSPSGV